MFRAFTTATAISLFAGAALADGHAKPSVAAADQDVSNGIVSATMVVAPANGWLAVHRTDGARPGPVVGHAPLRAGENADVAAILTEPVSPGEKPMLMFTQKVVALKPASSNTRSAPRKTVRSSRTASW